jgi:hypothetical protein
MMVPLIFAAIMLGAIVFLLRFLAAICGPEGKAPHIVYLAESVPRRGDPAGGQEEQGDCNLGLERGTFVHRRTIPIHVHHGVHRPKKLWARTGAGCKSKVERR